MTIEVDNGSPKEGDTVTFQAYDISKELKHIDLTLSGALSGSASVDVPPAVVSGTIPKNSNFAAILATAVFTMKDNTTQSQERTVHVQKG
jgi:hypothetical protein